MHTNETISESVAALTHPSLPPWTVSTGSHHRWRWPLWWTLSHTVSPHSPSVRSVCSSHQHSHSCTCCQHTPQPRRESVSRALLTCPEIKLPGLRCTGGSQSDVCCRSRSLPCFSVRNMLLQTLKLGKLLLSVCFVFFSSSLFGSGPYIALDTSSPNDLPPFLSHASSSFGLMTMTYVELFLLCSNIKFEYALITHTLLQKTNV